MKKKLNVFLGVLLTSSIVFSSSVIDAMPVEQPIVSALGELSGVVHTLSVPKITQEPALSNLHIHKPIQVDESIVLRTFEESDSADLFSLVERQKEYLRTWEPGIVKDYSSLNRTRKIISSMQHSLRDTYMGIWHKGILVGFIGLNNVSETHTPYMVIGYWLAEEYQGQGIMTKSCRAVIDYVFETLKIARISAIIEPGNVRSIALVNRLGFSQVSDDLPVGVRSRLHGITKFNLYSFEKSL